MIAADSTNRLLQDLTRVTKARGIARTLRKELETRRRSKFRRYFPDCQPGCNPRSLRKQDHVGLCRVLYRKHVEFFAAAKLHGAKERMFLAGNRTGKTEAAAYELTCHLTGVYPPWWPGIRFETPIEAWVAGDTMLTTRDIIQVSMFGDVLGVDLGRWTGMVPAHLVTRTPIRRSGGVPKCLETVWIRHVPTGGESVLGFRSYDQGRRAFQGTAKHVIWLDEEPPDPPHVAASTGASNEIYTECLLRTLTVKGIIMATFTPLRGLTPFVQGFLETAQMMDSQGVIGDANTLIWPEAS